LGFQKGIHMKLSVTGPVLVLRSHRAGLASFTTRLPAIGGFIGSEKINTIAYPVTAIGKGIDRAGVKTWLARAGKAG